MYKAISVNVAVNIAITMTVAITLAITITIAINIAVTMYITSTAYALHMRSTSVFTSYLCSIYIIHTIKNHSKLQSQFIHYQSLTRLKLLQEAILCYNRSNKLFLNKGTQLSNNQTLKN